MLRMVPSNRRVRKIKLYYYKGVLGNIPYNFPMGCH